MQNQYVCHSGVKGMKWGVRKKTNKKASSTKNDEASTKDNGYTTNILLGAVGGLGVGLLLSRYSSYSPWLLGSLGTIGGMSIVELQYTNKK